MPTADDLLSDEDDPIVSDLRPETIEGVANRLLTSDTFEKLVYRECEIDALWSLADIAVDMLALRETGNRVKAWQVLPEGSDRDLVMLRALLEEAHDFTVRAEPAAAAEVLYRASQLCASWS